MLGVVGGMDSLYTTRRGGMLRVPESTIAGSKRKNAVAGGSNRCGKGGGEQVNESWWGGRA